MHAGDRFQRGAYHRWDRAADPEAARWTNRVPRGVNISEFYQPQTMYYHAERTSRIDRAYTNLSTGELSHYQPHAYTYTVDYVAKTDHEPLSFSLPL